MYKNASMFLTVLMVLAMPLKGYAAAQPAATISGLKGQAQATSAKGITRNLYDGSDVYSGEKLTTAKRSRVTVRFSDNTRFELGPDADLRVDNYAYKKNAQNNTFATRILRGGFRFVTGLVARFKPSSMRVGLPVATIGIRGTSVVGNADATSATVILVEPEDEPRPSAILVYNQFGETFIDEPGYGTEVPDEHSAPSPARRMSLRTIQGMMRSITNAARIRPPRI